MDQFSIAIYEIEMFVRSIIDEGQRAMSWFAEHGWTEQSTHVGTASWRIPLSPSHATPLDDVAEMPSCRIVDLPFTRWAQNRVVVLGGRDRDMAIRRLIRYTEDLGLPCDMIAHGRRRIHPAVLRARYPRMRLGEARAKWRKECDVRMRVSVSSRMFATFFPRKLVVIHAGGSQIERMFTYKMAREDALASMDLHTKMTEAFSRHNPFFDMLRGARG